MEISTQRIQCLEIFLEFDGTTTLHWFVSPSSLLTSRITSTSPKTSTSLNTRIYGSDPVLPPIDHSVDVRFSGKQRDDPELDLDDEQLRALLASPLYLQEREEGAERSKVFLNEKTSCSVHLKIR